MGKTEVIVIGVLMFLNGALALIAWQSTTEAINQSNVIHKLEADVRTYSGKLYDLQDRMDMDIAEYMGVNAELQMRLEYCQNKK